MILNIFQMVNNGIFQRKMLKNQNVCNHVIYLLYIFNTLRLKMGKKWWTLYIPDKSSAEVALAQLSSMLSICWHHCQMLSSLLPVILTMLTSFSLSIFIQMCTGCFNKNGNQWSFKFRTGQVLLLKFAESDTDTWKHVHCKSCWAKMKINETTESLSL